MVLKRLLVTTLGALGLGALAAGPASAQQVPAPDLFDGQVACSSNVPAGMANGPLATALAEVVMDGDLIAADSAGVPVAESPVAGLNYIIPPGDNNCGGGDATYSDDDVTAAEMGGGMAGFEAGDLKTTVTGAIATDVATGYSETLTAYLASRTEDAAVKAASTALNTLLTDATEDGLQTAMITAARETLAAAETKRAAAHAKLYSVGAGPINMAGIAEWRAKFAVEDAVKAWNTAVGELGAAEMLLNPMDYAEYVPVTSTQLLGLLEMGTINLAELRTYANAEGMNTSVQDAMDGTVDGDSAFDGAGNLIVPMELWDHDMDGATDMVLRPDQESMTYMQVKERLDEVGDVVEALEKLQADNKNALLTPVITEGVRRAKVEQAHYQAQFAAMVADTTDINNAVNTDDNPDNDVAVISLNSRYAEYTAAETTRDNMGVGLSTAFQAREMATSAVAAAFTNSQAFYQQLVDRREFTKAAAEAEVTRLAGLTGDDAATDAQTTAAATAVTTAQTALDTATEAQAAFQDLIAEGSPVADLVNELLKSDAIGDDGGELVDAIAGAYEGQDAAAERLDELLRDEITTTPQLDADGNAVTNADGIPQRTEVVTELGRVKTLEDRVDALADDETVAGNTADIAANKEEIGGNTNAIDQLEVNLDAEVADRIAGDVALGVLIEDEKAARVAGDMVNHTDIMVNRDMIGTNVTNIEKNATAIMAEQTAREEAVTMLEAADTMLGGRIDTNVAGIMTNAGNIVMNEGRIGANEMAITSNDMRITANAGDISTNQANIASNATAIMTNQEQIDTVRAGVAASMALAGMPAINGRGISIGVGSFDGESAFAVGFQIQGEMASFKVGVTSGGGATGASAGVGFQF